MITIKGTFEFDINTSDQREAIKRFLQLSISDRIESETGTPFDGNSKITFAANMDDSRDNSTPAKREDTITFSF